MLFPKVHLASAEHARTEKFDFRPELSGIWIFTGALREEFEELLSGVVALLLGIDSHCTVIFPDPEPDARESSTIKARSDAKVYSDSTGYFKPRQIICIGHELDLLYLEFSHILRRTWVQCTLGSDSRKRAGSVRDGSHPVTISKI